MKKIYIAPNTDIVKVQTENLLVVVSGGGDVNGVSGGSDYVGAGSGVLSRGSNDFWDDEEEDEY